MAIKGQICFNPYINVSGGENIIVTLQHIINAYALWALFRDIKNAIGNGPQEIRY